MSLATVRGDGLKVFHDVQESFLFLEVRTRCLGCGKIVLEPLACWETDCLFRVVFWNV